MLNTRGTFADLIDSVLGIFNIILPVLAAIALVLLFIGIVKYISSEGHKSEHGKAILWSLVALFILLSIWGILRVLQNTFLG